MNLTRVLANTPLQWSLTVAHVPYKDTDKTVPRQVLTVVREPGTEPITMQFLPEARFTPDVMLAAFLAEHDRQNPALQQWRDSRGETPVEIEPYALEDLSCAMHTGLRKLADSKQSVITWNAFHHIHSEDRSAAWSAARETLVERFAEGRPITRRALAMSVRDAITGALDAQTVKEVGDRDSRATRDGRTEAQSFALRMLVAGCELTELDEWMWGWLGYVVKDAEATPAAHPA